AQLGIKLDLHQEDQHYTSQLQSLLQANHDVFATSTDEIKGSTLPPVDIRLREGADVSKLKRTRVFPQSLENQAEIERQLADFQRQNIIQRSNSPYLSNAFLVSKKDKSKRLVVDYRGINPLLELNINLTPTVPEVVRQLAAARPVYYTVLDCRQCFYQLAITPSSRRYTAFQTHLGAFEMLRLPMGLSSSPGLCQGTLSTWLASYPELADCTALYLDDLLLFTPTFQTHMEKLNLLLGALWDASLVLHPKKCKFAQRQITFIGHVFSADSVAPEDSRIEQLFNMPKPANKRQLRGYIGLINYIRNHIPRLPILLAPLLPLLRGGKSNFVWQEQHDEAFEKLRMAVRNAQKLCYPDERSQHPFI